MLKRYFIVFVSVLSFNVTIGRAHAVTWDVSGIKFGINAYLDLEHTYMEEMPMVGTNASGKQMIMAMDKTNSLDQKHMNLIFDGERDKFRLHININSLHSFSTEESQGQLEMLELYGEYRVKNEFKIRAGHILAPFGIYNEIRYITPMFAPVVLPLIYEIPNYDGTTLYPEHANIMIYGTKFTDYFDMDYNFYVGNGQSSSDGRDTNLEKQIGSRIRLTLMDNYEIGFSFFTNLDSMSEGRRNVFAGDMVISLTESLNFEAEYLFDNYERKNRKDRTAYYARVTYEMEKFTPFIEYNYFADYDHILYKRGVMRASIGVGYNFSQNIILKGEYHYHKFVRTDGLPDGTGAFSMFKTSVIFSF